MKKKGKTALGARITAFCMAAMMTVSLLPAQELLAAEAVTYTKVTDMDQLTDGKYIMLTGLDTGEGYAPGALDGTWVSTVPKSGLGTMSDAGDSISKTDENAVWELKVTTDESGQEPEVTAALKDANGKFIAPKGGDVNGIQENEYQWKASFTEETGTFTFTGQGEDTVILACNSKSEYKFRAYKTVTVTSYPDGYPSEFTLYKASDESGGAVAAPQASSQAGDVASGTEITLTSSTPGAEIYYTLDGTDPTDPANESRELYSADKKPVITAACTLKAVAVLNGAYSAVQTLQYTVSGDSENTSAPQDGAQVVIYAPAYSKALSAEYNGFYNNGTDVTVAEDGTLSGYTEKDVWTVKDNGDGTYCFSYDGQNIGMEDSYSSMPLGGKNDRWTLEEANNGQYYIKNTVRNAYMEWYDNNGNWSAYSTIAAGSEGMFALKFYEVTEDPGGTEEPGGPSEPSAVEGLEVESTPKSGASVVAGQKITLEAASGAEIYYTMSTDGTEPADPEAGNAEQRYTDPVEIAATPEKDKPVIVKAVAYIPQGEGTEAQTGEVYSFTYKAPMMLEDYTLYFGQLHAHTNLSDGTGTVEQAFDHAANVENLDFLALTDHSNSFEGQSGLPGAGTTHLGDENAEEVNASWKEGRDGARAITAREGDFVGIYGFEMTWSGGSPGHMNTFNSKGFENRNAEPYRKGDNYEVLGAYYNTLKANPETISQFNHPGDTFGDFMDFAMYDPVIDNQITLIEVGNGEGAIGSSGYFPSYSYYTRALDKGWHVAPTNNQDNHKGSWGDSNTSRSVVLSDGLSETAIYDAMRNYRVYATEDNDLSILYSLNGNAMGSILDEQEEINITANISDPTDTDGETKVEVIVNGGQTLAEKTFTGGSATVEFNNLSTGYGYYYLRVTQADKNIAVTAPVWTGESINAGISNTSSDVAMPIKGDEINLSSQIFNNLNDDMTVQSLTYTMEGQTEPFHTANVADLGTNGVIGARSSFEYSFPYTADQAGGFNVNAELRALIGGEEYTFTDVLKLSVSDPSIATKVLIDGTHYNDYVTGYYSGNMTNFINMGTSDNIQVKIVQPGETVTAEMLEGVSLFIASAPLKYTSDYTGDAQPSVFENDFIQVVSDYVNNGGTVVVCGLADYQDSGSGLPYTSYEQANNLLEGIGSTMRINDDELIDQDENGGQPYRLYFDDFNYESTDPAVQNILAGVKESGLTYSSYSGCSVSVGQGEAIVYGHETTYSINSKNPAQGHDKPVLSSGDAYDEGSVVVKKGEVVSMATEAVGSGRVYVCGTVFCSNFEVSSEDQVSYANGIMAQNLLSDVKVEPVISTIQEARAGQAGEVFTVVGTVANGTAESGNAFFNTIYIQDDQGNGINIFPIDDSNIRRGDQVQITGSVSEYIGDRQLSAISVTVLEGSKDVVITDVTTKEANDYNTNFGKLVRVQGTVMDYTAAGGLVESIIIQDDSGESCRVFIDGYIGYSDETSQPLEEFVKAGAYISAVGFVSHDAEGNRLRVRDRSEILPAQAGEEPQPESFEVTVSVQNGSFEGAKTAVSGQDYTGRIVAAEGYKLPGSITVKVAGNELSAGGIFRAAEYTYDPESGELVISGTAVTGAIAISVVCEESTAGQGGSTGQSGTPGQNAPSQSGSSQTGNAQNNSGGGQNTAKAVETGDDAPAALLVIIMAAAALAAGTAAAVIVRKRGQQ